MTYNSGAGHRSDIIITIIITALFVRACFHKRDKSAEHMRPETRYTENYLRMRRASYELLDFAQKCVVFKKNAKIYMLTTIPPGTAGSRARLHFYSESFTTTVFS